MLLASDCTERDDERLPPGEKLPPEEFCLVILDHPVLQCSCLQGVDGTDATGTPPVPLLRRPSPSAPGRRGSRASRSCESCAPFRPLPTTRVLRRRSRVKANSQREAVSERPAGPRLPTPTSLARSPAERAESAAGCTDPPQRASISSPRSRGLVWCRTRK